MELFRVDHLIIHLLLLSCLFFFIYNFWISQLGIRIMLGRTRAARRDPTSMVPNHGKTATSMWVCSLLHFNGWSWSIGFSWFRWEWYGYFPTVFEFDSVWKSFYPSVSDFRYSISETDPYPNIKNYIFIMLISITILSDKN